LFPFLIFALVVLHIWALHIPGNNNPIGIDVKKNRNETMSFHPYMVMKDLLAMLVFILIFLGFVFYAPNFLGHPDNYIPANPLVTPSHIVPEWYLLPFYAILRAIPSKLGGVIFMFASIFILVLLPWLDTSKVRSAVFRPLYKKFYWVLIAMVILLAYLGAKPPEGIYVILARIATAYYFIHFLIILPLLGRYEKTSPLPTSISDPVLDKPSIVDEFKKTVGKYEGENVDTFK
jgi:ubiquinol-cytochrome c reductase cytochrome b subunit